MDMDWVNVVDSRICLDGDELRDLLGTPYDYSVSDTTLELTMVHVDAIVSGHGPVDAYMRNTAAGLRKLPHALRSKAQGHTITVEFDMPVDVE